MVFLFNPVITHTIRVWRNKITPIDKGWIIFVNRVAITSDNRKNKIIIEISENSLIKILVLGTGDRKLFFFLTFWIKN